MASDDGRRRTPWIGRASGPILLLCVLAAALAACGDDAASPAAPSGGGSPAPSATEPPGESPVSDTPQSLPSLPSDTEPAVALRMRLEAFERGGHVSLSDAKVARDRVKKRLEAAGLGAKVGLSSPDELTVTVAPGDESAVRALTGRTGAFELRLVAPVETSRALGDGSVPAGLRRLAGRASAGASRATYLVEFPEDLPMDDVEGARPDVFTDADVASASVTPVGGQSLVGFELVADRKEAFRAFSAQSLHREMAIVVDGVVLSAPVIRSELPGQAVIEGGGANGFTRSEANELAAILNSGRLPCRVQSSE